MPHSIHTKRLTPPRARLLTAAALLSGVLVAGCGEALPARPWHGWAPRPPRDRLPRPGAVRPVQARPRRAPSARMRSPTPSACAPTACPTSQTRTPAGASSSTRALEINPSSPAFKAAQAKCQQLLPRRRPRLGAAPLPADAGEDAEDRAVHAPARRLRLPRPSDLGPVQPVRLRRQRRDQRYRRSDPRLPEHDRPAVAGVHAGGGRVRVPAAQPLMETKENRMPYSIHTKRLTPPRARLLTAAALLSGVLVAGCGGSSPSPTGGASTSASAASAVESGVAFTRCIRSHGVPNFPDPKVSGQTVRMGSREHHTVARVPVRRALLPAPAAEGPSELRTPVLAGAGADARGVRMYAQARDLGVPRSEHLASIELGRQQRDHRQRRVLPRDPEVDRHELAGVRAGGGRVQLRAGR